MAFTHTKKVDFGSFINVRIRPKRFESDQIWKRRPIQQFLRTENIGPIQANLAKNK
jgi:hypothetical protein